MTYTIDHQKRNAFKWKFYKRVIKRARVALTIVAIIIVSIPFCTNDLVLQTIVPIFSLLILSLSVWLGLYNSFLEEIKLKVSVSEKEVTINKQVIQWKNLNYTPTDSGLTLKTNTSNSFTGRSTFLLPEELENYEQLRQLIYLKASRF
ncbi:hypothetical protein [Algivirga pacifica]|uniref:DUF304 domain-containing protein n=1 Tax=Algivirga pacifica TaxID=1162670 RepID=A0ABP9D120_9BACT